MPHGLAIDGLGRAEIIELIQELQSRLEDLREQKRSQLAERWKAEALEAGLTVDAVLERSEKTVSNPTRAKRGVKRYQHPDNPSITWSGRGRRPSWVVNHIAAGGEIDELLVSAEAF